MSVAWTTRAYAPAERFDAWADVLSEAFLPWKITSPTRLDVDAHVRQRQFGDYRFLRCACDTLSGSRSAAELRETPEELLCLLHIVSGSELVSVDGQTSRLAAGDSLLWSSRHKVDFLVGDRIEKLTLMVPLERSRAVSAQFADLVGAPLKANHGLSSLFAKYLRAFEQEIWTIQEDEAESVMQATLELLLQAFANGVTPRPIGRAATLSRIKKDILERLADPELAPGSVARAANISLRYLHLLFAEDGSTVAAWIRQQRLERVKADLRAPGLRDRSITELGLRWGFNDATQFGRAFKRHVGFTPSEFRRSAAG